MKRILALACALALATVPLVAPTASASEGLRARIVFVKNWKHQFDSRVIWKVQRHRAGGGWQTVQQKSWRAGSGMDDADGRHECVRGHGWLPNGTYAPVQYDDYDGSLIKGRVFYLGDHACANGTERTQLFIHTETGLHNRQCADVPGDQLCRWEWPKINDYKSGGCIKMSPADLKDLTRHFHQYFRSGVRYPTARFEVFVR